MRVLVVSHVALYREGVADVLMRRTAAETIATAAEATEALEIAGAEDSAPEVLVLDMAMPEAAAIARRVAGVNGIGVLAIGVRNREDDVISCAEAGVAGFLTTEASVDDLVEAVARVSHGETLCSPWTAGVLMRRVAAMAGSGPRAAIPVALTVREREIADLLHRGLSNKQIAQRLCIQLPTVKNHVHHILDKLGVERRGEVATHVRPAV